MTKKVVAIGGGHGLSGISRQMNRYPVDYTAIVTPCDDGGLTRVYRTDYDVLSVGDYTLVVESLSPLSDELKRGLNHRPGNGKFNGNSARHTIFASLCMEHGPERAMKLIREIYQIPENRRIYLPTLEKCTLCAELEDETKIREETYIDTRLYEEGKQIERVFLDPSNPEVYEPSRESILNADMVIFGPGSLYTSTLPSCLVTGISDALRRIKGRKIYVCNLFTEPGSTHGYTVSRHLEALRDHGVDIDTVLVHTDGLNGSVIEAYEKEGKYRVEFDRDKTGRLVDEIIEGDFVLRDEAPLRHSDATGEVLLELLNR